MTQMIPTEPDSCDLDHEVPPTHTPFPAILARTIHVTPLALVDSDRWDTDYNFSPT